MPGEADKDAISDSESFKSKVKITGKSAGNVEIAVPLKYSRNFWRTLAAKNAANQLRN